MKLTKAQIRVLREVTAHRNGHFSVWALGTNTCEALRKRGLLAGDKPFTSYSRYDTAYATITDAGRAVLRQREGSR